MIRHASIIALILLGSCAPPKPATSTSAVSELADRTAGAPQRCIRIERHEGLRVVAPQMLAYGRGRTIWMNEVPECSTLNYSDVLITDPIGTELCRGDLVRTMDAASRIPGPTCRLGDFVPYTRD